MVIIAAKAHALIHGQVYVSCANIVAVALGIAGTFWLFAAINALAVVFVWRFVPETRGRTLEQIETDLRAGTFATP